MCMHFTNTVFDCSGQWQQWHLYLNINILHGFYRRSSLCVCKEINGLSRFWIDREFSSIKLISLQRNLQLNIVAHNSILLKNSREIELQKNPTRWNAFQRETAYRRNGIEFQTNDDELTSTKVERNVHWL